MSTALGTYLVTVVCELLFNVIFIFLCKLVNVFAEHHATENI